MISACQKLNYILNTWDFIFGVVLKMSIRKVKKKKKFLRLGWVLLQLEKFVAEISRGRGYIMQAHISKKIYYAH